MTFKLHDLKEGDIDDSVFSNLILEGFNEKFTHKLYAKHSVENFSRALANYYYANAQIIFILEGEEVCGCIVLSNQNVKITHLLRHFFEYSLGIVDCFRALFLVMLLSHRVAKSECYVEMLVVRSIDQGRGFGNRLIEEAQNRLATDKTLTLYVANKNKAAYYLYKKKQFHLEKIIYSRVSEYIMGVSKWSFMRYRKDSSDD